jgi:hypothetical protein
MRAARKATRERGRFRTVTRFFQLRYRLIRETLNMLRAKEENEQCATQRVKVDCVGSVLFVWTDPQLRPRSNDNPSMLRGSFFFSVGLERQQHHLIRASARNKNFCKEIPVIPSRAERQPKCFCQKKNWRRPPSSDRKLLT